MRFGSTKRFEAVAAALTYFLPIINRNIASMPNTVHKTYYGVDNSYYVSLLNTLHIPKKYRRVNNDITLWCITSWNKVKREGYI